MKQPAPFLHDAENRTMLPARGPFQRIDMAEFRAGAVQAALRPPDGPVEQNAVDQGAHQAAFRLSQNFDVPMMSASFFGSMPDLLTIQSR